MRRGWVVLVGLGLFVAGGLLLPAWRAGWLALGAAAGLAFAFLVVVAATHWSASVGWGLAAVLAAGVGGVVRVPAGRLLATVWAGLSGVQFLEPAWLWLLASLPFFFLLARRGLGLADLDADEKRRLKTSLTHLVFAPWGLVELVGFVRGREGRVAALGRGWVGSGLRCRVFRCL